MIMHTSYDTTSVNNGNHGNYGILLFFCAIAKSLTSTLRYIDIRYKAQSFRHL